MTSEAEASTAQEGFAPRPMAGRRGALSFILITVSMDVLSFGVTIPVFPRLFEQFTGGDVGRAAALIGVVMTLWSAIQLFSAPLLGGLSDRFGRRPVILLSNLGTGLDFMIMALAPSLGWLFVGRILNAVTASSFSAANAYVADVTVAADRAKSFGYVEAAFSFGFIIGPMVGGVLGQFDPRLPFWVGAALSFVNFLYGCFLLPESLPLEQRRPFAWRHANPLGALRFIQTDRVLLALATVFFLVQLAHQIYTSIWVLYTGHRFGWSSLLVGMTLAFTGVMSLAVQGLLIAPITKRIGERNALEVGLYSWIAGDLLFAVAWTPAIFLAGMPLAGLSGLVTPSLKGIASRRVETTRQGQLQGTNSAMQSLAGLTGPALFTGAFAFAIGPGSAMSPVGTPFYISSGLLLAALVLAKRAAVSADLSP